MLGVLCFGRRHLLAASAQPVLAPKLRAAPSLTRTDQAQTKLIDQPHLLRFLLNIIARTKAVISLRKLYIAKQYLKSCGTTGWSPQKQASSSHFVLIELSRLPPPPHGDYTSCHLQGRQETGTTTTSARPFSLIVCLTPERQTPASAETFIWQHVERRGQQPLWEQL